MTKTSFVNELFLSLFPIVFPFLLWIDATQCVYIHFLWTSTEIACQASIGSLNDFIDSNKFGELKHII